MRQHQTLQGLALGASLVCLGLGSMVSPGLSQTLNQQNLNQQNPNQQNLNQQNLNQQPGSSPATPASSPLAGEHIVLSLPSDPLQPNGTAVALRLQTLDADQQPIPQVRYHLSLQTPDRTPWFTTDFPLSEGTTLLELSALAPDGTLDLAQVLPIRGHYTLQVQASFTPNAPDSSAPASNTPNPNAAGPASAPVTLQQPFTLIVPERSVKYRNGGLWAVGLLLLGLGGGWLIRRDAPKAEGDLAPQGVRLLLSGATVAAIVALLYVNVRSELGLVASDHGHHSHGHSGETGHAAPHADPLLDLELNPELNPELNLKTDAPILRIDGDRSATVGQLFRHTITATDPTGKPLGNLPIAVQTVDLDHDRPIFRYIGLTDARGQITWRSHFFDAADHQVQATPLEFGQSEKATALVPTGQKTLQLLEINAVPPPLSVRFISLAYLMAFFGIGLALGFSLDRRSQPPTTSSTLGHNP